MSVGAGQVDWSALVPRLIHPTKVLAIEAMLWIDRPMSAVQLKRTFDGKPSLGAFSYHLKGLAAQGVLEQVGKRGVRGAWENFYFFAEINLPSEANLAP